MTKISVIIPIHNAEQYLRKCILSVINQSIEDWEMLLINNCSIDKSESICKEFTLQDPRIKLIEDMTPGVSNARNTGLKLASGNWIFFLDADDWLEPNTLAHMLRLSEMHSADLVSCNNFHNFEKKQKSISKISPELIIRQENEIENYILDCIYPQYDKRKNKISIGAPRPVWGKLFKKDIIIGNKIEFPTDLLIAEDAIFCIHYLKYSKKIVIANKRLYHYRVDAKSANHRYRSDINQVSKSVLNTFTMYFNNKINDERYTIALMGLGYEYLCKTILNYTSKDNKTNFSYKIQQLKDSLDSPHFRKVFQPRIDSNFTFQERMLIIFAKRKYARILYLVGKIKQTLSRFDSN